MPAHIHMELSSRQSLSVLVSVEMDRKVDRAAFAATFVTILVIAERIGCLDRSKNDSQRCARIRLPVNYV